MDSIPSHAPKTIVKTTLFQFPLYFDGRQLVENFLDVIVSN